ncbi:MAG: twin-arginine translocation signal domain-containing protein, partial [Candidatus Rokuibacteriota bacterium]
MASSRSRSSKPSRRQFLRAGTVGVAATLVG